MARLTKLFMLIAVIGVIGLGCQNEPSLVDSDAQTFTLAPTASKIMLPADAEVESATFYVYAIRGNDQTVNVHRITADWDEMVVTWNNFGGSFAPEVIGSFVPMAAGWYTVDVTALVMDWMAGTYMNYGILMDQVEEEYPRAVYLSRENVTEQPYLEICYSTGNGPECVQIIAGADAFIWELNPNQNNGDADILYTGWEFDTDLEKQSMLWFEMPGIPPQEGCTHTIGYWKNWTGLGKGGQPDMVTQYLPIWLGNAGGTKSIAVTDVYISTDVLKMKTYGKPSNGITKLYAQLLGAKLSIASGASDMAVADAISDADDFLADHDWTDWGDLSPVEMDMVLDWKDMFDDYNNGRIGPGHCDEMEMMED